MATGSSSSSSSSGSADRTGVDALLHRMTEDEARDFMRRAAAMYPAAAPPAPPAAPAAAAPIAPLGPAAPTTSDPADPGIPAPLTGRHAVPMSLQSDLIFYGDENDTMTPKTYLEKLETIKIEQRMTDEQIFNFARRGFSGVNAHEFINRRTNEDRLKITHNFETFKSEFRFHFGMGRSGQQNAFRKKQVLDQGQKETFDAFSGRVGEFADWQKEMIWHDTQGINYRFTEVPSQCLNGISDDSDLVKLLHSNPQARADQLIFLNNGLMLARDYYQNLYSEKVQNNTYQLECLLHLRNDRMTHKACELYGQYLPSQQFRGVLRAHGQTVGVPIANCKQQQFRIAPVSGGTTEDDNSNDNSNNDDESSYHDDDMTGNGNMAPVGGRGRGKGRGRGQGRGRGRGNKNKSNGNNGNGNGNNSNKDRQCSYCNRFGHIVNECRTKKTADERKNKNPGVSSVNVSNFTNGHNGAQWSGNANGALFN